MQVISPCGGHGGKKKTQRLHPLLSESCVSAVRKSWNPKPTGGRHNYQACLRIYYILISCWHLADNGLSFLFCIYLYSVLLLHFHQPIRTGTEWGRVFNFVSLVSGSDRCYQLLPPERWREREGGRGRDRETEWERRRIYAGTAFLSN